MIPKTRILAVSSDPVLTRLLEEELDDADYEVSNTQRIGNDLKEVLYSEHPDFVIMDVIMPNLDGIGACLTLRQWTQVPIMMLSTWNTGDGMVRGLNLGSETYLTEPFGIKELKVRISETLKRNAAAMTDTVTNTHTSNP